MYYIQYASENNNVSSSVLENGTLQVVVDLPGVDKDSIHLSYSIRQLDFTYTRDDEETKTKSLTVHSKFDVSQAKASMKNGALKLLIPARETTKNKIKIE